MFAVSIPAFLSADRWGRRTSAIASELGLADCTFLVSSLYAAGTVLRRDVVRWVVIVAVFSFGLTYCAAWGIRGKIYASEIRLANTCAAANCVAHGLGFVNRERWPRPLDSRLLCWLTNWLAAIWTPILLEKSAFGAYFLFGGLALGAVTVLSAYMPEFRGCSLEDIQRAFHRPTPRLLLGFNLRPISRW